LVRTLEVLARQMREPAFRDVVVALADSIRAGRTLSDGMARHPEVFDRIYLNMIRAGEAAGELAVIFERLASYRERSARLKARVQAAMIYPAIVTVISVGIVWLLLVFVVPKFEGIFAGLLKGRPLPLPTHALLTVAQLARQHAAAVVGAVLVTALGVQRWLQTTPGRRMRDAMLLCSPWLGQVQAQLAIARFCRTFGTLLGSGVPILGALAIARETSANEHVADAIALVAGRVKAGSSVAGALVSLPLFPAMTVSMIQVGEETGRLPEMLGRIADTYEEEVERSLTTVTALIEPAMIVLMAVIVGAIVIALFLPLVGIIQGL
jgi:type IV pilus assembly protein PilC